MLDVATVAPPIDLDDPAAPGSRSAVDAASDDDGEDSGKNLGFIIGGVVMGAALVAMAIVIVIAIARLRAQRQPTVQPHAGPANSDNPAFNEARHAAMGNAEVGNGTPPRARTPQHDAVSVEFVREQHGIAGNAAVSPDRTPDLHAPRATRHLLRLDTQCYVEGSAARVYATVDYADMAQPQTGFRHQTEA